MTWKIVTDSGCDLRRIEELAEHTEFQNVPLTIQIGSEIFVDDEGLDVANMMTTMYASPVSSKSSCPSPDVFLQAYQGAENVIAITITGNLSGSQNSAQVAKHMLLEEHPNVNVHVIDSLSAGGEIDLPEALLEMMNRGKAVPGGVCGFWGACGAGISTGMFISIISGATPLKNEPWGLANKMTSKALDAIGSIGGPRCCKRDSYIAIISAIDYVAENFNIQMEKPVIKCIHSDKNNQCIKERCPFHE